MPTQTLASPEELAGRIFESAIAGIEVLSLYLGDRLGYYAALAQSGPMTPSDLALKTATNERYAREWLEQQATAQILGVHDPSAGQSERRYFMPEGYEAVLVDETSDAYVAPVGRFLKVMGQVAEPLLEAYRTGEGVSWVELGEDARTGQAAFNRPFFANHLVEEYIKGIEGLDAALAAPGARCAEIGPGGGWALIALARSYPGLRVDGFDIDEPTVAMARENIASAGLTDRVAVHSGDAANAARQGEYDLVAAFECVHDMPDPVAVLASMRRMVKPGGTVLVMDERVADEFGNFGDPVERLLYGASIFVCLPDGMSTQPTRATGTVMRASVLAGYAREAGFANCVVLPLEHDLFRFYQLS